jgi:hypothetical protein
MKLNDLLNKVRKKMKSGSLQTTDVLYGVKNDLPGLELGIPLYLFEKVFTTLHYGENVEIDNIFLVECLIGMTTYGIDRYMDALDYEKNKESGTIEMYDKKKVNKYENIIENKGIIFNILFSSYAGLVVFMAKNEELLPFIPLLCSTLLYKNVLKEVLGIFKSTYIGVMWVFATIFVPCILHDHDYSILKDYECYLPALLTLVSSSNLADVTDYTEDKEKEINTIPVEYGKEIGYKFSLITIILSSILLYEHPNFSMGLLQNGLFELNNAAIGYISLNGIRDDNSRAI